MRADVDEPVRDHEAAVSPRDDVELDEVDPGRDGGAKRLERVLGRERLRAAMADPERPSVATFERDHGAGLVGR